MHFLQCNVAHYISLTAISCKLRPWKSIIDRHSCCDITGSVASRRAFSLSSHLTLESLTSEHILDKPPFWHLEKPIKSAGKSSGQRAVCPCISAGLRLFLQPQLSPPGGFWKNCRFSALPVGFIFQIQKLYPFFILFMIQSEFSKLNPSTHNIRVICYLFFMVNIQQLSLVFVVIVL